MIHVTPTSRAPLFVSKFLLANEHQVVCVRFHLAKLLGPASLVFAGLIVAALLSSVTRGNGLAAVWLAWGVLLLWLIWKLLNWLVDYFVVTSKRVLLATGLLVRKVEMMPLVKVTDMSYQQSLRGRALKYGRFIFESAGQEQALREVDYIPDPEQHYLEVCGLIFADEDRADSGILRKVVARHPALGYKPISWRQLAAFPLPLACAASWTSPPDQRFWPSGEHACENRAVTGRTARVNCDSLGNRPRRLL